jgi:succinyl-CoA synthetase beta subunit
MKLLEHEAKSLLRTGHVPVPEGIVITKKEEIDVLTLPVVLKSQVPVGGRGKLGGVVIVETIDALADTINGLFALDIKHYKPNVLLAEEKLAIKNEHYLSLLIDRGSASVQLVAHRHGGIEVEANDSADFLTTPITKQTITNCAEKLASYLGYPPALIEPLLDRLFDAFVSNDATLLEINPLVYTESDELICGDCKMELDDAAAFRHKDWNFEDTPSDTNFVTLNPDGTVATIANGAGLAMATVDAVTVSGMVPANFLDIGGGANTASVLRAFTQIMEFPNIQTIVINIFAGITRCDEVARAIIEAKKQIDALPPLFIRLAGTNFEEAVTLLAAENITTLSTLEECLTAAKEVTHA